MVISHMKEARLFPVIVSSHKIIVRMSRHIGGGHGNVFVPGNIHAGAVIHFVIRSGGNRKVGNISFPVIHYSMNIRRENGPGMIIYRNRRIGPPQKGLRPVGPVIKPHVNFQISLIRI